MFTVNRDPHRSNYTCISNAVLLDKRLSLAVRGFFAAILSLSADWDFSVSGIAALTGVHEKTAYTMLQHLEELGYLRRMRSKNDSGRYNCTEYIFSEAPLPQRPPVENPPVENPPAENPPVENPPVKKPPVENPPQINNNITNTKETSKRGEDASITDVREAYTADIPSLRLQINADELDVRYGQGMTELMLAIMADGMENGCAGVTEDLSELRRVLGLSGQDEFERALNAAAVNSAADPHDYFLSVLYDITRRRERIEKLRAAERS